MIIRHFQKGDTVSSATYSSCERFRYALTRMWNPDGKRAAFVMLNPSQATEANNDPTVERCERRARMLGFGAFRVTNIFAYRATDPAELRKVADPIGPKNDWAIEQSAVWSDQVICGWGFHGAHAGRGAAVEALLRATDVPLFHLSLTQAGHPRHPLYISYRQRPIAWQQVAPAHV